MIEQPNKNIYQHVERESLRLSFFAEPWPHGRPVGCQVGAHAPEKTCLCKLNRHRTYGPVTLTLARDGKEESD